MIATQPATLRYRLEQDTDASDPRQEWDHFATMVCDHDGYELGDRKPTEDEQEAIFRCRKRQDGFVLLERYLRRYEGAVIVKPLGLLDHSGLHMYLEGGAHWTDSAGWDSGTVGFIYVTREQMISAGFHPDDTPMAQKIIEQEVEEYDQYLTGDVWGYIIEQVPACDIDDCDDAGLPADADGYIAARGFRCECACHEEGEHVDSCWGFYGHQYAEQEARDALKLAQEQASADFEKYAITC